MVYREYDKSIVPMKQVMTVEREGAYIIIDFGKLTLTHERWGEVENDYTKIAEQLKKYKTVQGLMKYIKKESLIKQHKKQENKKATGIDKISKAEYEKDLGKNVKRLIKDMKSFSYKPQPVRKTYIPKANSEKLRPLGILAYEDKLVQGAF